MELFLEIGKKVYNMTEALSFNNYIFTVGVKKCGGGVINTHLSI